MRHTLNIQYHTRILARYMSRDELLAFHERYTEALKRDNKKRGSGHERVIV